MDPIFMAYVMNEKGEPLSIEEVRERLVSDKPLILNPDANWNRKNSQTVDYYLKYYMSKNLYKLECPVSSEYNYETAQEGKARAYMQLLPGTTKPAPVTRKDKHGVPSYTLCYTNNPKTFWAAPYIAPQTTADFEHMIGKVQAFYNANLTDSLTLICSSPFNTERLEWLTNRYGKFISYKYIGRDQDYNDVALFKVVTDKKTIVFGFSIEKNNKIGTFRFDTSSPYIQDLLAKEN